MIRILRPAKLLTFLTIFVVFAFVFTSFASAIYGLSPKLPHNEGATSSATKDEIKERVQDRIDNLKEKFEARLEEKKKKICERVEARINKRSDRLVTRAERMTDRFDKIADKVKDYYTDKLVPKGVTIDNYDALVADIATKGAAVDEVVATAKAAISEFDCDGDSPKGVLSLFRGDMKTVITALKDYRTSVVNLLVAVRTKGKNIKSPGATGSSEPATGSASP